MNTPIRIIFVDDEPALRSTWEKLIAAESDMTLAASLPSADALAEHVARTGAALVLMDVSLPGTDALTATAELARTHPECRVVMYSGRNDFDTVRRAYEAGAWGFVDKLEPVQSILQAIRRVCAGELAFPRAVLAPP